jgi:hypothetical protein
MSSPWIPFSEKDRLFEVSEGAVVNHLTLPVGVDEDRILLHPERIARLGGLAGAKQTHLLLHDRGDVPDEPDYDTETQSDGTLVMSGLKQRKKKASNSLVTFDDSSHPLKHVIEVQQEIEESFEETDELAEEAKVGKGVRMLEGMFKADAVGIYIPKVQTQEAVKEKGRNGRGVLDEHAWANTLNDAAKRGLTNAAFVRYVQHGSWVIPNEIMVKYFVASDLWRGDYGFPAMVMTYSTIRRLAQAFRVTHGNVPISDFNPSIMLNFRTDRYLATVATAKMGGKIIKYAS